MLEELRREGDEWVRSLAARPPAWRAATARFSPLTSNALETRLLHRPRGNFGEGALYLKPNRQMDATIALWCRWDFQDGANGCWYYLGIWPNEGGFLGFRFEMPEAGDNHNYYHSQPCRNLGSRQEPIAEALPLPERNPTWPLAASSPLELLLCLVLSIRGMQGLRHLNERMDDDNRLRQSRELRDGIQRMLELAAGPRA